MKTKIIQLFKNITVDSLTKNLIKLFKYLFISSAAVATSQVNAATIQVASSNKTATNISNDYVFNIASKDLILTSESFETINVGSVIDTGITSDIILITHASDEGVATFNITSIDLDAGTTPGVVNFTDTDGSGSNVVVNISGLFETLGVHNVISLDEGTDLMTVNYDGNVIVGAAMIFNASGGSVTGSINGVFSGATISFGASLDLGTTRATATFDRAGAQAVTGTIEGTADAGGHLVIAQNNSSGVATFNSALGGINHLASTTINANSAAVFAAGNDGITLTNNGTMTANAGVIQYNAFINNGIANFISANTANSLTNEAAGASSVGIVGASSVTNFNTATTHTATVQASFQGASAGAGTINVINTNDAAPGVVTFTDVIGASTTALATLNVGNATRAGAMTQTTGKAYVINTINITGGNANGEDSVLNVTENLTASSGITLNAALVGDATLNITDDVVIAGTITGSTAAGAGDTDIIVTGSSKTATFNETISGVDLVSVSQASALFKKDVTTTTMLIAHSAGDATFNGTADTKLTGTVTATNGEGTFVSDIAGSKTLTVTGTVATTAARLLNITVANDSNTIFESKVNALTLDINTDQAANGTADFVQVTHTNIVGTAGGTTGALQIADGAEIRLDRDVLDGTTVFDVKEVTGSAAGVLIDGNFNIRPSTNFTSGTVKFIDGANSDLLDSATVTTNGAELANMILIDNSLTDYSMAHGAITGQDANIVATAKTAAATGIELGVGKNEATAIRQSLAAVANDATLLALWDDVLGEVNGQGATDDTALAQQVAPQTDTVQGTTSAQRAMTGSVQGIVSNRMAALRSGDAYVSGMAAGNGMTANSGFIQAFSSQVEQDNIVKGSATEYGYDAETSGVAIGFDGMSDSGSTLGLSASFSSTDVDGLGTGKSKNSIDSYTVSVYGDATAGAGYLEGSLTYGINENSSSRLVNVEGLSRSYSADYDSEQIALKVTAGMPNEVGDGTFLTPFGSVNATIFETDTYLEKSTVASDVLRLKVAQDTVTSMVGSIGVKAHKVTDKGTPMISLAFNNEFGDTTINATNTYQGGGTAFKTTSEIEELSATLGVGYTFGNDLTSLNIGYEANANDAEYLSHYGSIKLVSKF